VQGEQGTDVMESDDIHPGHVTDDLLTHGLTVRLPKWHLVLELPSLTEAYYHLTHSHTQAAVV